MKKDSFLIKHTLSFLALMCCGALHGFGIQKNPVEYFTQQVEEFNNSFLQIQQTAENKESPSSELFPPVKQSYQTIVAMLQNRSPKLCSCQHKDFPYTAEQVQGFNNIIYNAYSGHELRSPVAKHYSGNVIAQAWISHYKQSLRYYRHILFPPMLPEKVLAEDLIAQEEEEKKKKDGEAKKRSEMRKETCTQKIPTWGLLDTELTPLMTKLTDDSSEEEWQKARDVFSKIKPLTMDERVSFASDLRHEKTLCALSGKSTFKEFLAYRRQFDGKYRGYKTRFDKHYLEEATQDESDDE